MGPNCSFTCPSGDPCRHPALDDHHRQHRRQHILPDVLPFFSFLCLQPRARLGAAAKGGDGGLELIGSQRGLDRFPPDRY